MLRSFKDRKKIWILAMLCFLFINCENGLPVFFSESKILTGTSWQMISFVDHATNKSFSPNNSVYTFYKDGQLEVLSGDTTEYYSTWAFTSRNKYLRIGSNTFKVKIITHRLLGLRYGSIDIFYTPV